MGKNIEIKVQVDDLKSLRHLADQLADQGPFELNQIDYFFPVPAGRLKLRVEHSDVPGREQKAELVSYHRSDEAVARASDYILCAIPNPDCLRISLYRSLGEGPVVRKRRELYLSGRTRLHLDTVQDLGEFVEIEVVMQPDESEASGLHELQVLMSKLGLENARAIDVAYADLLAVKS